ncbi:MAG: hydrogenase maturation protease [Candidatus Omnitrophica bacterium]|nr:hydrogenase maturation protease [Candidatus Omnitrophota bacterium]
MKKTLIIGVGSILRGDDGIGMRVIDELKKEKFPPDVELHGADISGMDLLKYLPEGGRAIIIDAADMNLEPGDIRVFGPGDIKKADLSDSVSTHGMALLETLTLAEKLGIDCGITVIGVQPENTGYDLDLSETVKSRISDILDIVKEQLFSAF